MRAIDRHTPRSRRDWRCPISRAEKNSGVPMSSPAPKCNGSAGRHRTAQDHPVDMGVDEDDRAVPEQVLDQEVGAQFRRVRSFPMSPGDAP